MKKVIIFFLLTAVILAGLEFMADKEEPVIKEQPVVTEEQKYENLAAFAKLYGLVRYYHPSDEAADLDWERFAVYGAGEMKKASNQKELIGKLKKLFDPIAPTMTLYLEDERPEDWEDEAKEEEDGKVIAWQHYGVNSVNDPESPYRSKRVRATLEKGEYQVESERLFDQYPKVHERVKKQISDGIYCDFPLVLYVDDNGTIGDEKGSRAQLKKLKENLKKLDPAMTSEDEDVRFAGIITTWTILNHFYPYFEVTDSDWQNQLHTSFRDVADDKNREDYTRSLMSLIEKTMDGHASSVFMKDYLKGSLFPFIVDVIGNEVVVTVAAEDAPVKAGDIIVEINDQKGMERIEKLKTEIPGSPQYKEYLATKYFRYGDSAQLTLKRGDEILEHHVKAEQFSNLDEFNRKESFIELEDDIFYFDMVLRGEPKTFNENIDKLSKAKGIIFDLRGYPKSMELALSVLGHLTDEPIKGPVWRISQSIYPDREKLTFNEGSEVVNPVSPLFSGKAVFLTYAGAMSYPEYVLGYVKYNHLAEIVGQPTAGSDGNIQTYPIPGGFTGAFTGMEVLNADKTQTHIVGIKPTVQIERTMEGVKRGEDEYIAKALELLKQ